MISLPILAVLLVVIFGSFAAASLPLAIGVTAILGAFTALRGFAMVTDVSIFAVNIVTIIGLGLAIDYGLFMVSRFREEIRRQPDVETALARTMATAGRTVAVSGITVAISLAGLLIFPQVFLRSMGFGGVSAVLVAMLAALTLLPALLAMLGTKVDALSVRPWLRRVFRRPVGAPPTEDTGAWHRIAHIVMRRPIVFTVATVTLLVVLALPFLRVQFGGIDERALPAGTESRVVAETIRADFPADPTGPIEAIVTLPDAVDSPAGGAALQSYVDAVADVPGVDGATVTGAAGETARVAIAYDGDPVAEEARALVNDIRDVPAPEGAEVLVGGQSAVLTDLLESLGALLPWMALMVVATTFVLLFLAFGSIVLPIKALAMNVLSHRRLVRRAGLDLPGRPPVGVPGLHAHRVRRGDPADPRAGDHLRAVDGLRGLPDVPDPGAVRPDRRQHRGGRDGAAADRRDHHQRGAAAARGDRGVLAVGDHVHQDDRRRDADRRRGGRDDRPDPARAGDHAAARAGRTGTPRGRCAGCTRGTASGSPTANRRRRSRPASWPSPAERLEGPPPVGGPSRSSGQTAAGALSWGTGGRGRTVKRSTGWVSSSIRWRGASRTRRAGRGDGGSSLPQPTQYRPRCSTALQCAHDMVPPRLAHPR